MSTPTRDAVQAIVAELEFVLVALATVKTLDLTPPQRVVIRAAEHSLQLTLQLFQLTSDW